MEGTLWVLTMYWVLITWILSFLQDQRKAEEPRLEAEEHTLERSRRSHKTVALNSPKSLSSPVILPSAMCSAKLSPCHHSPSLRPRSGCPTPQPTAVCPLPSCPTPAPAIVPQSSVASPPPSQSSAGSQTAAKRVDGEASQHYPESFEPGMFTDIYNTTCKGCYIGLV